MGAEKHQFGRLIYALIVCLLCYLANFDSCMVFIGLGGECWNIKRCNLDVLQVSNVQRKHLQNLPSITKKLSKVTEILVRTVRSKLGRQNAILSNFQGFVINRDLLRTFSGSEISCKHCGEATLQREIKSSSCSSQFLQLQALQPLP